jgi:NADPH:quinone reductase-like Zn-dependent oxidoreductase
MASIQQWTSSLKGLDSLKLTEATKPTPGKGEVLVEIHAVSLNYRDVEGMYIHTTSSIFHPSPSIEPKPNH